MRLRILFSLFFMWFAYAKAQQTPLTDACKRFDAFNTAVRDNKLKKAEAMLQFQKLIAGVKDAAQAPAVGTGFVFPLQGYNYKAIGGYKGNGYADKGYSYFDGNKHLAHPAHDIFISDRNQDCIDDKTHGPVNVLAVADGVVIACTNQWESTSALRGGKYIWIYHPAQNILTYYAHNGQIFVEPGTVVKQGQKIAEVGRTGFNAYKKRSPTHLHFSAYHLVNNLPVAYNCYNELVKAVSK